MYIQSTAQLRDIYGHAKGRAKDKQLNTLEKHSINFVEHSPFLTISTHSSAGLVDCSPRGGEPGFVKILNRNTILLPEAKGNNRLDSLCNILETGNIACLFFIPGVDETLRLNGTARISTSIDHLALFSNERNPPKACIELTITEVFLHCAKAFMRAKLWSEDVQIERSSFPTMGTMINEQLSISGVVEKHEDMVERYQDDL